MDVSMKVIRCETWGVSGFRRREPVYSLESTVLLMFLLVVMVLSLRLFDFLTVDSFVLFSEIVFLLLKESNILGL